MLSEQGRGGMGVVYQARQAGLNRLVALKMVLAGAYASEEERSRFRPEAEAIARLHHANIVQIFEVGEQDGLPYFSLEYCPYGSLADRLDGTPQPAPKAAELVEALARAMQVAHSGGIVHRDLKPANVLFAPDGTAKVADFGLAKYLDSGSAQTATGAVLGTPSYMAPEQAGGKTREIGPAADVCALGAILYELLTGRPPFKGATPLDTLEQVRSQEPVPPGRLQQTVPRDLETICLKCLDKEPRKRFASAGELADDLRRWLNGEPIRARPVGAGERTAKWVRRHAAITALAAAVLLVPGLGVAGIVWKYFDAEQQKGIAQGKEQEAQQEADKAKAARDFLIRILRISEADSLGGSITARQILADAEQRIPVEFADQPELRAELVAAIAHVKRGIARRVPHAMILEVRGAVQLHSAVGVAKPAVPQALVNLDDRLTLSPDAQVRLIFLSDFHKERLRPGREAAIDYRGCEPADAVAERDDSVLMTFVRLAKGTFFMCWDGQVKGIKTDISEDFEIAVHDVTQAQWQAVMGYNPSYFSRKGNGRNGILDISDEELKLFPVEMVSWDDAQEFIKRLNDRERGRGYWYRLPTDAEWEYACRGGATSEEECSYHFYVDKPTNDLSSEQANFDGNFPGGKAPMGKFLGRPSRVGAYPPNKLGLCDMHGNVWQWCVGADGGDSARVFRGGSWQSFAANCQAAYRAGFPRSVRQYNLGFRLVRVPVR